MPAEATAPSLRYQVLGTIARGGMAEIQLARAFGIEGFETLMAIKRILPHLSSNHEFVQMFLDEGRIAATLHHPHIVQVHGIGAEAGDYFLTMEFLHGEDVRHIVKATLERGLSLPLEHALSITLGVASALHYAHEKVGLGGTAQGLIHRDVSPQNVIVTYDGGVKLVDFGIAKAASRITETREGTLKGKVPYMSPEQCLEKPLDRRSDVFSLTVMLWELLCGRRLFTGASEFEVLKEIVERDAPLPSQVWPACPTELDRIVARGLCRDPDERYPTARALQSDLEAFARDQRLPVSSIGLATYMADLFSDKLEQFRAANAAGAPGLKRYVEGRRELNKTLAASSIASLPGPATIVDRGSGRQTPNAERDDELSVGTGGPRTKALPPALPPTSRHGWYVVAVAAAIAGGALTIGAYRAQRAMPAPPQQPHAGPIDPPGVVATPAPGVVLPGAPTMPTPTLPPQAAPRIERGGHRGVVRRSRVANVSAPATATASAHPANKAEPVTPSTVLLDP